MAIYLPIISQFSDRGIKRAKREFASLEKTSQKVGFMFRQAFAPATAALGGLAVAGFSAATAAMEDAKAQAELARQLQAVTGATYDQIAGAEEWIASQGRVLGVTDDELRPAYGKLIRVTKDFQKTQGALSLAMDVSAATGKDLNTVTDAFAKALGGNVKALSRTFPQYKKLIDSGASVEEVFAAMSQQVGGAATEAAETTSGKFQRLKVRMDELKESIGEKLLPVAERIVPWLEKVASWAERNQGVVLAIAAAFGVLATAIIAVNVAMMLNPAVLIVAGLIAIGVALVTAYKKFEGFRNVVDSVAKFLGKAFGGMVKIITGAINQVLKAYNYVNDIWGGQDVGLIGQANPAEASAAKFRAVEQNQRNQGAVQGPFLPGTREAIQQQHIRERRQLGLPATGVVINVNGGDPRQVVDAVRRYTYQNGRAPITIR